MKKDIKSLGEYLNRFQLSFKIDGGVISLYGNEKKLRHLKMIFILKYVFLKDGDFQFIDKNFFCDVDIIDILKEYMRNQDIARAISMIEKVEKEMGVFFEKEFRNIIMVYLLVTFERIDAKFILDKKNNSKFLRETTQYKIIKNIIFLENQEKYRYEALHLTEYFLSGYNSESFYENRFSIEIFVYKILEKIGELRGIKFTTDKVLLEEMIEYLTTAVYRIKNNFTLNDRKILNISHLNIKENLDSIIDDFQKYLPEPLREEEIINMSYFIGKAEERKKKLAIDLSKILEIVERNSEKANLNSIGDEILNLYGNLMRDDRNSEENPNLLDILDEKQIIFLKNVEIEDAINFSCDYFYKEGYVDEEYKNGVLELLSSQGHTLLLNQKLLLCYGKKSKQSKKLGILLVFLENEELKNEQNYIDYLVLVSNIDRKKHIKAINQLKMIIEKDNFFSSIKKLERPNLIIESIEKNFSIKENYEF